MEQKTSIREFLKNWQFLDIVPVKNDSNSELIDAIKLYNNGDFILAYDKLSKLKQSDLLVNFYCLLALSNCPIERDSQLKIASLLVDLYNKEKIKPALWYAAQILAIHDPVQAQELMTKIIKTANFPISSLQKLTGNIQAFNIINNILINHNSLAIMTIFDNYEKARFKKIKEPHEILGLPEKNITKHQSQYIDWLLTNQWEKFTKGYYIKPKFHNAFGNINKIDNIKTNLPRVLFMGWQYFLGDERDVIHISTEKWVKKLVEFGYKLDDDLQVYYTDKIAISHIEHLQKKYHGRVKFLDGKPCITDGATKKHELQLLHEKIAKFKPDIIIFDQNNTVYDGEDTISAQDFLEIKQKFGVKIMRHLSDYHDSTPSISDEWVKNFDLFTSFGAPSTIKKSLIPNDKFIDMPSFANKIPSHEKPINFGFAGGIYDARKIFMNDIESYIPNSKLHQGHVFKNITDYDKFYASCKMTFNTGFRGILLDNEYYILTARAFESIANRVLLLEEDGAKCADYFVPWCEFIPVNSRAELIIYGQFFAENPIWWQRITDQAFKTWQENYDFPLVWRIICAKLGFNHSEI